jgi:uncharacterized protein (TIGR00268 family)
MYSKKLFEIYKSKIIKEPDLYYSDYLKVKDKVDKSSAIYNGKPVKFLYQPMFFIDKDIEILKSVTNTLKVILDKVIERFIIDKDFRKCFNFPKTMEDLILEDPGYGIDYPMARFDLFYGDGGYIKFCELNADGSSSMNEQRVLYDILSKSLAVKELNSEYKFFDFELFDSWIDVLIENYEKFSGTKDSSPNIAIADFEGEGIISEFGVFKEYISRRGYNVIICSPKELEYKNKKLYYGDTVIDLIYRRATTVRIVDNYEHIKDFIKAYKEKAVCVVGGMRSQIIHNKIIFSVLHDKQSVNFLTEKEHEFIKNHIPYTCIFEKRNKVLMEEVCKQKNKYVLKPFDEYSGKGVYMGADFDEKTWIEIIDSIEDKTYIVQEFCEIPAIDMLTINGNKEVYFEKYGYLVGVFMYNGQFKGLYTRVGRKNIIAATGESLTVPNFILTEQKLNDLKEYLKNLGGLVLAYSGGVDSTFLLKVAHEVIGDKLIAVTAKSSIHSKREFKEAVGYINGIGAKHIVLDFEETDIEGFSKNPIDRCYYCKKELFKKIISIAQGNNIKYVADGSNYDDLRDYRPGIKAVEELNVVSPLRHLQFTKEDIRYFSKKLGLPTWDKPAFACLASRIPYGDEITKEKLDMIDKAEQYLIDIGFKQIRVRHHGDIGRIELGDKDFTGFSDKELMKRVAVKFKDFGFKYVCIDLEGYRTGSMNEVVVI